MQPARVLRGDRRVGRKGMRIMGEAENTQRFDCIVNFFPNGFKWLVCLYDFRSFVVHGSTSSTCMLLAVVRY